MVNVSIVRYGSTPQGTFGELFMPEFHCFTVERPWLNNATWVSCIPAGEYDLQLRFYNRGGYWTAGVVDVPGRSHILFHKANVKEDVQGCIGLGNALGTIDNKWAVIGSSTAFKSFKEILGVDSASRTFSLLKSHTDKNPSYLIGRVNIRWQHV